MPSSKAGLEKCLLSLPYLWFYSVAQTLTSLPFFSVCLVYFFWSEPNDYMSLGVSLSSYWDEKPLQPLLEAA